MGVDHQLDVGAQGRARGQGAGRARLHAAVHRAHAHLHGAEAALHEGPELVADAVDVAPSAGRVSGHRVPARAAPELDDGYAVRLAREIQSAVSMAPIAATRAAARDVPGKLRP